MFKRKAVSVLLFVCLISQAGYSMNPFEGFKEIKTAQSPEMKAKMNLGKKDIIKDLAVLPDNSSLVVLIRTKDKKTQLVLWQYKSAADTIELNLPNDIEFEEVISHPQEQKIFLLGNDKKKGGSIFSYDFSVKTSTEIYRDSMPLSDLTASPAKFSGSFRLFFSRHNKKNTEILSVTDSGQLLYPVLSNQMYPAANWMRGEPKTLISAYGVPVTFNPLGNVLLWYNKDKEIFALPYEEGNWGKLFVPDFALHFKKGESIEFSPNGMYLLHWPENPKNLMLVNNHSLTDQKVLTFDSTPVSRIKFTRDGKGIAFIDSDSNIVYVPLNLPLYDVENAWMFCADDNDMLQFSKSGALFRPTNNEQMFNMYYSENYDPSGKNYVPQLPARPYLVTVEPFYETLEAAFSGIFYLNEKAVSLKRFREFVSEGKEAFTAKKAGSPFWGPLFENASQILDGNFDSAELLRVKNCDGIADSKTLQREGVNFIEFKTRGYYEQDDVMNGYFKAVQYLSMARPTEKQWEAFGAKKNVNLLLKQWRDSYKPFIPPSQQVLPGGKQELLSYVKHRKSMTTLVPKPWGIDTESFDSLVYHDEWPVADKVVDENGSMRSVPDIYELADVFGSSFAKKLLDAKGDSAKYPMLEKIHGDLMKRWKKIQADGATGIFNKWLNLVSVQLSSKKPDWPWLTEDMWKAKQLQTGLSGWTNLRHSTYIFNEMQNISSEDGESGFELLSLKPPRGAVEPVPEAFGSLSAVFNELKNVCYQFPDVLDKKDGTADSALNGGIIVHLNNAMKNIELFKSIAEKEKRNEPLSNDEYNAILICGRAVEHDFLTFKSICTMDMNLAVPKALPKCVDVYGDTTTGILYSCIGFPLEWDVVVPYFGRREIVKGTSYLHDSFAVAGPVTDDEWYEEIKLKPVYPEWLAPYLSKTRLQCPARTPFLSQE